MDRRIIPLIMCGGMARLTGFAQCAPSNSCRCSGRARPFRTLLRVWIPRCSGPIVITNMAYPWCRAIADRA